MLVALGLDYKVVTSDEEGGVGCAPKEAPEVLRIPRGSSFSLYRRDGVC